VAHLGRSLEIRGARVETASVGLQASGDDLRGRSGDHAERDVDAISGEVHHVVAAAKVDVDLPRIMSTYRIHSIESAPEKSKPALQDLQKAFGFIPNLVGAMAESPVLIGALVPVFHEVHSGSFSEAEVQVVLLTNAVTNSAAWPVALHSKLALDAGVGADDVQAIRARRAPRDARLAALSGLARALESALQPHAWSA
jgi:hypothetical protein